MSQMLLPINLMNPCWITVCGKLLKCIGSSNYTQGRRCEARAPQYVFQCRKDKSTLKCRSDTDLKPFIYITSIWITFILIKKKHLFNLYKLKEISNSHESLADGVKERTRVWYIRGWGKTERGKEEGNLQTDWPLSTEGEKGEGAQPSSQQHRMWALEEGVGHSVLPLENTCLIN